MTGTETHKGSVGSATGVDSGLMERRSCKETSVNAGG